MNLAIQKCCSTKVMKTFEGEIQVFRNVYSLSLRINTGQRRKSLYSS